MHRLTLLNLQPDGHPRRAALSRRSATDENPQIRAAGRSRRARPDRHTGLRHAQPRLSGVRHALWRGQQFRRASADGGGRRRSTMTARPGGSPCATACASTITSRSARRTWWRACNRWAHRDTYGGDLVAVTDEMSAPSDRVVQLRLKKPFPTLKDLLGKAGTNMPCIMPERLAKTDPMLPLTEMVGSGPFRFVAEGARARRSRRLRKIRRLRAARRRAARTSCPARSSRVCRPHRVARHPRRRHRAGRAAIGRGRLVGAADRRHAAAASPQRQASRSRSQDKSGFLGLLRLNHLQPPFDNPAIRRAMFPGDQPGRFHDRGRRHRPEHVAGQDRLHHARTDGERRRHGGARRPAQPRRRAARRSKMPATRARRW